MRFPKLKEAKFKKRLNRFVGLIELEGKDYTAYIRNTGRLKELLCEGNKIYVAKRKEGKHPFEIVLAEFKDYLVCIDSHIAPKLYAEYIKVPVSFEPTFGDKRFDLLLGHRPVEVKSVNLVEDGIALFPDAPTERGRRGREILTFPKLICLKIIYKNFLLSRGTYFSTRPMLYILPKSVQAKALPILQAFSNKLVALE